MKNSKWTRWCVMVMLVGAPLWGNAQLLKGKANDGIKDLQVGISLDGDILTTQYQQLEVKNDGTFEFDAQLLTPFNDVTIYVNDDEGVGAHLVAGKRLELTLGLDRKGHVTYDFKGDAKTESEFYTRFSRAFDFMRYFPMDPSKALKPAEALKMLEQETKAVRAMLPTIRDAALRDHYAKFADAYNKYFRLRMMTNEAYESEKSLDDYPEYDKLLATVDVNDEYSRLTGLSGMVIDRKIPQGLMKFGGDMAPWGLAQMEAIDRYVTNPDVRKSLARSCAYTFFTFGKGGDYMKFWNAFQAFAKDYPELIEAYAPKVAAMSKTAKGTDAINAVMQTPDGKTCKLSDFFGKFTYVDVWATWCDPCCAEIPHLEKLVEHFKGNGDIQFISISVDANQKAWLAKLEKDKPEWAQFILSKEEAKHFMDEWGITGIPRFIMIDRNGKIYAADAARPSDKDIIDTLEKAITEK